MQYVALLRAVNLAGKNAVAMADLRVMAETQGFSDVRTLLQSGNLLFSGPKKTVGTVERGLEAATAKRLGVATDFFVRTGPEIEDLVARNPFPAEAKSDPGHLLVLFLKSAVDPAKVKALQAAIAGREVVRGIGAHVYVVYPDGVGRSRLTMAVIERHLGTRATGRNWNTVLKLRAMAAV